VSGSSRRLTAASPDAASDTRSGSAARNRRSRSARSDRLAIALRELVDAAGVALAALPDPIVLYQGLEEWDADPSDPKVFRRRAPVYPMLRTSAQVIVEGLPEWSAAMTALREDDVLGSVVDQLVGTALGAGLIQSDGLLHSAIERSGTSGDLDRFLADLIERWRTTLGADPIPTNTLVVVGGVQPTDEVHLSDNVVVRAMTDEEVAAALRVNAMPIMPVSGPLAFVHDRTCIAIRQDLRRVIGDDDRDLAEATSLFAARDAQVEASLASLRLLGVRNVCEHARLTIDGRGGTTIDGRGGTQYGLRGSGLALGPPDLIDPSLETRGRAVFAAVARSLASESQLAIAIRRFSGSHEPRHGQDRLLDLWIAIEALFSPDDASEVTFRVALNVANTVVVAGVRPRTVFDWVKRAYGLRSDLVHGRPPSFKKMPRIHGGMTTTIIDAADDLAEVVGIALLDFLMEPAPGDFTDMALRDRESSLGTVPA
jgi:hypothetical protein